MNSWQIKKEHSLAEKVLKGLSQPKGEGDWKYEGSQNGMGKK